MRTFNNLVIVNPNNSGRLFAQDGVIDLFNFLQEGWELFPVDIFLQDHHIVKVELFLPVDFDLTELLIVDELIEGVFGPEPFLVALMIPH